MASTLLDCGEVGREEAGAGEGRRQLIGGEAQLRQFVMVIL